MIASELSLPKRILKKQVRKRRIKLGPLILGFIIGLLICAIPYIMFVK